MDIHDMSRARGGGEVPSVVAVNLWDCRHWPSTCRGSTTWLGHPRTRTPWLPRAAPGRGSRSLQNGKQKHKFPHNKPKFDSFFFPRPSFSIHSNQEKKGNMRPFLLGLRKIVRNQSVRIFNPMSQPTCSRGRFRWVFGIMEGFLTLERGGRRRGGDTKDGKYLAGASSPSAAD